MAVSISGKITEVVFARFEPHEDLRQGLLKVIKERNIKSGVVLSITGALERAVVHGPSEVGPPSVPMKLVEVPGPLEVSGHGIIGIVEAPAFGKTPFGLAGLGNEMIHGEPYLHVHLTVTSATQTRCGHLMDGCLVRSNYPVSHFTVVLARIKGAVIKMVAGPGKEPGSLDIGHQLARL